MCVIPRPGVTYEVHPAPLRLKKCVSLEMECAGATFADLSKAGGKELGVCAPISGGAEGRALGFGLVASSLSTALVG